MIFRRICSRPRRQAQRSAIEASSCHPGSPICPAWRPAAVSKAGPKLDPFPRTASSSVRSPPDGMEPSGSEPTDIGYRVRQQPFDDASRERWDRADVSCQTVCDRRKAARSSRSASLRANRHITLKRVRFACTGWAIAALSAGRQRRAPRLACRGSRRIGLGEEFRVEDHLHLIIWPNYLPICQRDD